MGSFDINIGQLTVPPGHFQAGMPQHLLQAKDITAVAQEFYCRCMAESMGRTSDSTYSRFPAVVSDDFFHTVFGEGSTVSGKEEKVAVRHGWFGAVAVNIVPEQSLNLLTYWDEALLISFAQDLENAIFQPDVVQLQVTQLRYPHGGIQQSQDDGMVAVTLRRCDIYGSQQLLHLEVAESRDDPIGWSWNLHPVKGITLYEAL